MVVVLVVEATLGCDDAIIHFMYDGRDTGS
jgi:hypothetical protein